MEKQGIEELTIVTLWSVDIIKKIFTLIEKSKKGKRVNGWDSLKFIKPLIELIRMVGSHKKLGKEWINLDEVEKAALNKIIKEELELEDEKAEEIGERVFYLLMEIGDFITDVSV